MDADCTLYHTVFFPFFHFGSRNIPLATLHMHVANSTNQNCLKIHWLSSQWNPQNRANLSIKETSIITFEIPFEGLGNVLVREVVPYFIGDSLLICGSS